MVVSRDDDPKLWIADYFAALTVRCDPPVRMVWNDKSTGNITWDGTVLGAVRFKNGGTDSTQGPGDPMQLHVDVPESTFTYAVAVDDELAALDWALHDLGRKTDLNSDTLLDSLRTGWAKRHDHSRLWRGDNLFPVLQHLAWNVTSLPGSALSLWIDPPYTVELSYGENHVSISPAEHDTVTVDFTGMSVLFEYPLWVHGLNSWVEEFFRRLPTENLWRVRTRLLGIPVRQDFVFDRDLPIRATRGIVTKSAELFLPAALKSQLRSQ